jgi:hypothetical protein
MPEWGLSAVEMHLVDAGCVWGKSRILTADLTLIRR